MSEQRQMLADTVNRLFVDAQGSPRVEGFDAALWAQVVEMGLVQLLVPESKGGAGADWEDAGAVLHAMGLHGTPIPLAESIVAAQIAAECGLELPEGLVTLATRVVEGKVEDGRFSGTLAGVPWARHADAILAIVPSSAVDAVQAVLLRRADATSTRAAQNLAGEPRDDLVFSGAVVAAKAVREASIASHRLTLARCAQIAGALESALRLSVEYAQTRRQFGRAIGQFQAVQQQLAQFGGEVAAANCAARSACRAAARSSDVQFQVAAAKLRCNIAIGLATSTAHQVHAAIGFTHEYALRQSTQRLWSWRSECGNDRACAEQLGAQVCARGAENFWVDLTVRDDAVSSPPPA